MDVVAGPVGSLIGKLGELLAEEYKLQKGARAEVERLRGDLEHADAALRLVAQIPPEHLDETDKLWVRDIREASYDMEDIVDAFLVRVDAGDDDRVVGKEQARSLLDSLWEKISMNRPFSKAKARRQISRAIEDVKKKLEDVARRHATFSLQSVKAKQPAAPTPVSSRLLAMHSDVKKLVGIDKARDELISMLKPNKDDDDDVSSKEMKKVSVVGVGGLGKTTIAKVVYDELIEGGFDCATYVTVGQKPDLEGVLREILIGLDKHTYSGTLDITSWSENLLIHELQEFLRNKRYLIFIDDIWDTKSWKRITPALKENYKGSRIITTTRGTDVAEEVGCSYKLQPLSRENSRILFYGRIFGSKEKCPEIFTEVSENILKKCGDVPLAIITISGLLDNKPRTITEWNKVYESIGSGNGKDMSDMRKIIYLSYYDLPPHLKTCLLYLCIFPEDYEIVRNELIWRWIAEDFIRGEEQSDSLFEIGKSYFNDLINRGLILPERGDSKYEFFSCRVHDMVLDFIRSTSNEENFVTVLAGTEQNASPERKVRRLSLLKYNTTTKKDKASTDLLQVRSFIASTHPVDLLTFLPRLHVVRVLDLGGFPFNWRDDPNTDLRCVGNLTHLRYLRLGATNLRDVELPAEIGKLHFLQILCLYQGYPCLPSNIIGGLRGLLRLDGVKVRKLQNGIWGSLEVLNRLIVDEDSTGISIMEQLGQLTQLRVLWIDIDIPMDQTIINVLFKSLCNLKKIRSFTVRSFDKQHGPLKWNDWVPPPDIRKISINFCAFFELPNWISNSTALPLLYKLRLKVLRVKPEDIESLRKLPSLADLCVDGGDFLVRWLQGHEPLDKCLDCWRSYLDSLA